MFSEVDFVHPTEAMIGFNALGIEITEELSSYLCALFIAEMQGKGDEVKMPNIPLDALEEYHYAVRVMVKGFKNRSESLLSRKIAR